MVKKCFLMAGLFFFISAPVIFAQESAQRTPTLPLAQDKLGAILGKNLSPSTALGQAVQVGDLTLVPIISKAFGFGLGNGLINEAEEGNQGRKGFGSMDRSSERERVGYGGGGCMRVEAIMIIKKDGSFEIVRLTEGALAQVAKIVIPVIQDAIKKKFESRMRHEKEKFPVQENPQDKPKPE